MQQLANNNIYNQHQCLYRLLLLQLTCFRFNGYFAGEPELASPFRVFFHLFYNRPFWISGSFYAARCHYC